MNLKRYIIHTIVTAISVTFLILPGITHAEDSEIVALRAQIQELRHMVIDLQQQVEELQARSPSAPPVPSRSETPVTNNTPRIRGYVRPDLISTATAGSPPEHKALDPDSIRENWHALEKGMTNQTVNGLLGAPTRSFKLNNNLVWYYDYKGIGRGSVMFSEKRQVIDWQAPPTSHWFW